jgi:hypothetical protein
VKALPARKPGPEEKKPGRGRFQQGHDSRRNTKPPPPGPGRPKLEYLQRMRELASKTTPEEILVEIDEQTRKLLLQHHPRTWLDVMALRLRAWESVADRGFSKATVGDKHEDERPLLILLDP